jgi:hypothetical protein
MIIFVTLVAPVTKKLFSSTLIYSILFFILLLKGVWGESEHGKQEGYNAKR